MADVSGPQLISTTGDADSDQIIVPEVCCLIFIYLISRFSACFQVCYIDYDSDFLILWTFIGF